MAELLINDPSLTVVGGLSLSSAMLVGDTTATFNTTISASSGTCRVAVDVNGTPEILLVTCPATSGTTYTVARAQEGTTAAAHASGVPCRVVLTAAGLAAATVGLGADNSFTGRNAFGVSTTGLNAGDIAVNGWIWNNNGTTIARRFKRGRYAAGNASGYNNTSVDTSYCEILSVTLNQNWTCGALANAQDGQEFIFILTQDATGGRSVTWPTGLNGMPQPSRDAGSITVMRAIYDGTAWYNSDGWVDDSGDVVLPSGHFTPKAGAAPAIAAAGSATAVSLDAGANDMRGRANFTTPSGTQSIGTAYCTVTFATAYTATPTVIVNEIRTGAGATSVRAWAAVSVSTTSFQIASSAVAAGAATAFKVAYLVVG